MSRQNNSRSGMSGRHFKGRGHGIGQPAEKARDFKGTILRLSDYLRPARNRFVLVFFLAVASTLFAILGPKILGKAVTKLGEGVLAQYDHMAAINNAIKNNMPTAYIDQLRNQPVPGFDFSYIGMVLLGLIALYLLSSLFSYAMSWLMASVSQETVYNMRNDVKNKLDQLPLKYFDENTHGDILSRVTNDMDNIANTLQQSLTQLITAVVTVLGILVMMISISPLLTLIALITLPAAGVITAFIASYAQKYFARQQKFLGELNGHVEEMYAGHQIVKLFNREADSIAKFRNINDELYQAGWRAQFVSGIIHPALSFINNIGYVLVVLLGGLLVTRRAIDIGDIQAFIQYMRQFTQPIAQVANIFNILQSTVASAERVFEILDEEEQVPERDDAAVIPFPSGNIRFENVIFSYKADTPLIKDLNIDVKQGETVAIVGPTGAGKTTLVNLIMRFYEVQAGKITVDGVDIRDMRRGDLRTMFGMVLQDTWLFNGTIMANIGYGSEGASEAEIIKAARLAHAHHFIMTLPEGYDTILNEEASNISQGQKQLLTIARAFLADPPILILDEATSNIDTRTEVLIHKALANLQKNRTSFVIAHRLSTIRHADLILVMDQGAIIEEGTHEQLLAREGFYADLYNSQFSATS